MTIDILWQLAQLLLVPAIAGLVAYVRVVEVKGINAIASLALAKEHAAKELADFKTYVAEKYSTNAYTQEVDQRLMTRLAGMDSKLDRLIERKNA